MRKLALYLLPALLGLSACHRKMAANPQAAAALVAKVENTFARLLSNGPDPWVYQKNGYYYYLSTTGGDVSIRKTTKMSELSTAPVAVLWRPSAPANARDLWAPELHFLDGHWYIYVTAGPGSCCAGQRLWVLENIGPDPTQGTWLEKGRLYNPGADYWAIDATVFEQGGKRYLVWSGHHDDKDNTQRLYISEMSNPWTLVGPRVELSRPQYDWEKHGPVEVNEGPEILQHGGNTFLIYSASHCSTDDYALGQLRLPGTADPLDASKWVKSPTPVFSKNPAGGAYGPGHGGFFKSKDGTEDWMIYHANSQPGQGCGDARNPRMQKFTWNADGSPHFGEPAPIDVPIRRPAGE
jgi:GH43 family beta-xylosidase